jgi:hypothetical protein
MATSGAWGTPVYMLGTFCLGVSGQTFEVAARATPRLQTAAATYLGDGQTGLGVL